MLQGCVGCVKGLRKEIKTEQWTSSLSSALAVQTHQKGKFFYLLQNCDMQRADYAGPCECSDDGTVDGSINLEKEKEKHFCRRRMFPGGWQGVAPPVLQLKILLSNGSDSGSSGCPRQRKSTKLVANHQIQSLAVLE